MSERQDPEAAGDVLPPDLAAEQRPGGGSGTEEAELERHGNVDMENAALRQQREPDRANRDVRP